MTQINSLSRLLDSILSNQTYNECLAVADLMQRIETLSNDEEIFLSGLCTRIQEWEDQHYPAIRKWGDNGNIKISIAFQAFLKSKDKHYEAYRKLADS